MKPSDPFPTTLAAALLAAAVPFSATAQCLVGKLHADDPMEHASFGTGAAIEGDLLVAGALADEEATDAAYVFRFDGSTWTQEAKLTASDGDIEDQYGFAALSGDVVLVGAFNADPDGVENAGAAYVYRFDGTTWVEEQKLVAPDPDPGDNFGIIVALAGDVALLGASGDDEAGEFAGSAYIYRYDGTTWNFEAKLLPAELDAGDALGFPVSLSPCGTVALIGAGYDDHAGIYSGAAYVYRYDGTTWVEEARLTASDAETRNYFGFATTVDRDVLAIGAFGDESFAGSAYVFRYDGSTWTEEIKIAPAELDPDDYFASDLHIRGDVLAVVAPDDDDYGTNSGAAYVYRRVDGVWTLRKKLTASVPAPDSSFGTSVWLDGDRLAVGNRGNDEFGTDSGTAEIFAGVAEVDYNANGVADVCEALCPADANGDGEVNFEDLLRTLADWGPCKYRAGCPSR